MAAIRNYMTCHIHSNHCDHLSDLVSLSIGAAQRDEGKTEPPGSPFSIRPASLKPLFGTVSHAFQSRQPLSVFQLTDLSALSGDPNPIE
jgi:hypothetical protein